MEEERISILMKYVRGEISFAEWIEAGVGSGDAELEDSGVQDVDGGRGGDEEILESEIAEADDTQIGDIASEDNNEPPGCWTKIKLTNSNKMITVLVTDPIFAKLAEIGSVDAEAGSVPVEPDQVTDSDQFSDLTTLQPAKKSKPPLRMTDLLLQGSAAKSAKKHGGTGVDEFMEENSSPEATEGWTT
ncbi:hypothetical protein OS493_031871 [Desmophyllum pertusum]|uniref:Uncharacterized protein n=2 Tax=Desmophyllum pertusum TaxID=174260 RepID=A0A9X0CEP7_9CNID|nr:hypothetical protein OS493_031871 [Desmophyllum pertusum]